MNSAVYEGWIRHRRFTPRSHSFRYRAALLLLDLAELDEVFRGRLLWSARGPALAWFRRADHFGDPRIPLDDAVRDLVAAETGRRPAGPIRLLTHLRYLGYCMNPVSFYYIHGASDDRVETVVAEVHNTPWNETHCYVLDASKNEGTAQRLRFRFAKRFHVSPFLGMDVLYDWRFGPPGDKLAVHMECARGGAIELDATMVLARRPVDGAALARVLFRYPAMTAQVIAAIYWQALRLRLKGVPVFAHPKDRAASWS